MVKNISPAFKRLGEIIPDGVKEFAIKENSDYKTSNEKVDVANINLINGKNTSNYD